MPPETCSAHGELMRSVGAVEEGQRNICEDLRDIKSVLARWEEEAKTEAIALAERKTKSKIIWAGMGATVVAGISAGVHILIKKMGF